jgi:predicted HD phosphohydrolase
MPAMTQTATFTRMDAGTAEDWSIIIRDMTDFASGLADRVLDQMTQLAGDHGGYAVDRLEHSLQTATLATQAGEDEEYVVCALLHDIGDWLGPYNHADHAAVLLRPFVSPRNAWMVEQHGIFQGYYFFEHLGLDRNLREKFRGHPDYAYTADFCDKYDQRAFDPGFASMPLTAFEPMVRRVLARPKSSIYMKSDNPA